MNPILSWILQVLVLSGGIYMFLSFVRTPRVGGLIRGLTLTLLGGAAGVWWVSTWLHLEELLHVFTGLAGYVALALVLLFQPEIRRGLSQVGSHPLVGRLFHATRPETLTEVAQAAVALARRRHGALIAFELDTPLDEFVQSGVPVDAAVSRILLESIFQPGGALHDGAVVIRKDRATAALCLFPLTENAEIARSTGTRHRAALGLTDVTDAVTVAVSEEDGAISLCRDGVMRRDIPPKKFERILRETLEPEEAEQRAAQVLEASDGFARMRLGIARFFQVDLGRKALALLLGSSVFWAAHQDIMVSRTIQLRIVTQDSDSIHEPAPGQFLIRIPSEGIRLDDDAFADSMIRLSARGTRGNMEALEARLGGVLELDPARHPSGSPLPIQDVTWFRSDRRDADLVRLGWDEDRGPTLGYSVQRRAVLEITPDMVRFDLTDLPPYFEVLREGLAVTPATLEVEGPESAFETLEGPEAAPLLANIVLSKSDTVDRQFTLQLHESWHASGLRILGPTEPLARLQIRPIVRSLSSVSREVALVCMVPERVDELAHWSLPGNGQTATFNVLTRGILFSEGDDRTQALLERSSEIIRWVEKNLVAYVDVSETNPSAEDPALSIRFDWRDDDWRSALFVGDEDLDERADIWVELTSESKVLLNSQDPDDSENESGDESP